MVAPANAPWFSGSPTTFPIVFLRRNRDHQRSSTLSIYAAPGECFYDVQRSTEHEIDEVWAFARSSIGPVIFASGFVQLVLSGHLEPYGRR